MSLKSLLNITEKDLDTRWEETVQMVAGCGQASGPVAAGSTHEVPVTAYSFTRKLNLAVYKRAT